jgi:hypothetical protein
MSRRLSLAAGLTFGLVATAAVASTAPASSLQFRVLLDGQPIGQHRFEVRGSGEIRDVVSRADFRVRILFLDVYRYQHVATERWRGDCLESLDARTDDNGDIEIVTASRSDGDLAVNATRTEGRYDGCVRSFAYWSPEILEGGRLLNSQTGELVAVRVLPLGEERIEVNGKPELTRRYRLAGEDLQIDLWYAAGHDWVALESRTQDRRRLRYDRDWSSTDE